jgi:membrane associated rhomboid family serine protease
MSHDEASAGLPTFDPAAGAAPESGAARLGASEEPAPHRFPYGGGALELGPSGFRAPRWPGRGEAFVAYRDITHVAVEPRGVAIGTLHGVVLLGRAALGGEAGARALAGALRERVFALPGGDALRARFERLDAKQGARRPWIAALLVALAGVAFLLQQLLPGFYDAAIYRPPLLAAGEWWRYFATQFLHANFAHLATNAIAALVGGAFVERALGRSAALFVAGASGAGAMLASAFGSYSELLGFSGVASGFFGALVAIEFFVPEEAPASARIPRLILVSIVALQGLVDVLSPHIASLAHVGGFAAGALAALAARESTRDLARVGAAASGIGLAAAFGLVAKNVIDPASSLERRATAMAESPVPDPGVLNNLAWEVATAKRPTPAALDAAAHLAELAVVLTARREPTVLDTLAEVYFVQERTEEALDTIDEAIALAPGEQYYVEQRRRFSGERAADDRPAPPPEPERPARPRGAPGEGESPGSPLSPDELRLPPGDEITV